LKLRADLIDTAAPASAVSGPYRPAELSMFTISLLTHFNPGPVAMDACACVDAGKSKKQSLI